MLIPSDKNRTTSLTRAALHGVVERAVATEQLISFLATQQILKLLSFVKLARITINEYVLLPSKLSMNTQISIQQPRMRVVVVSAARELAVCSGWYLFRLYLQHGEVVSVRTLSLF
jgi:hypothetical protein